jgi:hypothetical protein
LKVSIFGLKTVADLERQRRRPLRSTAMVFLGDRYVTTSHDATGEIVRADGYKALYPFRASITADTLATFHLTTGDRLVPTTHPGATILNYLTRSISGLRAKDAAKLGHLSDKVLSRYPDVREWIHDGPGCETLDLARVLHTLREPARNPQTLLLGDHLRIAPYRLAELVDHPGFMASHLAGRSQRAVLQMAHVKSRLVGRVEAKPTFVTFWQKHIEDRLRRIIHND